MTTAIETLANYQKDLKNPVKNPTVAPIKTKFPLVSVVIPIYNSEKYICAAINSVLEQTYGNYEIIVIDDGSTDNTRDRLNVYEDKIRYVYQANEGSASARNLGIKIAKGELIAFLDADDYWVKPDKLAKQIACFQDNPNLGLVNTGWLIVDGEDRHIRTIQPWHNSPRLDLETWLKNKCVRTSAMMFRREWLEQVNGFDEELAQSHDVDLVLRLSLAGCQSVWLKEETVCYRQHDRNTTKDSLKQAEYLQKVLDKFFAHQNLPSAIRGMESQFRYDTLVWLAWYQYQANNPDKMSDLLKKSLQVSPYLRAENIAYWLTGFEQYAREKGQLFNADSLVNTIQWQNLVNFTLELNGLPSEAKYDWNIVPEKVKDSHDLDSNSQKIETTIAKKVPEVKVAYPVVAGEKKQAPKTSLLKQIEKDSDNLQLYYQALESEVDNPKIYLKLAEYWQKRGEKAKAIVFCKMAILYYPNYQAAIQKLKKIKQKRAVIDGYPEDMLLPPLRGDGNDYSLIEEQVREFIASKKPYTLGVSLIIPTYNRKNVLAKTLAAIVHQTYPAELIEVIVADDGSSDNVEEVILKYEKHLELIHVRQEDRGYRLSAVRNLGIRAAKHNCLIILDCDMLPDPNFVEAYMQYLHASDRVALIGHRRFVCTDDLTDDQILENIDCAVNLPDISTGNEIWDGETKEPTKDWRLKIYEETDYLKAEKYPFRAFVGATIAYSRNLVNDVGYYDEDFQHWGEEDKEYGYRIYNAGYYFIPVLDAVGLHQEPPGGENENDRKGGKEITTKILEEKCPAGWYRKYEKDRVYEVPKVSIYIPSYNNGKFIKECVDSVLNQTFTDLEICICDDGSSDNTIEVLETNYQNHPRVRWVVQENGGIGKASNTAVRMCRGMYIGQIDSDDVLRPHAVETLVKYLDNHDVGCVYSGCERIDTDGNYMQDEYNWPEFSREKMMMTMIVHHFRMFRRRDWMRTTGFDETIANAVDYDMFQKLSEICDIYHINEMLYLRRIHGKNTSVVNIGKQDKNNNVVLTAALKRMGLADEWEVYSPDPENPRRVSYRRKNQQ